MNSSGTWSKKNIRQQREKDMGTATNERKGEREQIWQKKLYIVWKISYKDLKTSGIHFWDVSEKQSKPQEESQTKHYSILFFLSFLQRGGMQKMFDDNGKIPSSICVLPSQASTE